MKKIKDKENIQKKSNKIILLLLGVLIFFIVPLFTTPFFNSHDGEAHVARFAAYYQAFQDRQLPPRWAGTLNYGYGTPVFNFYYPLPGYMASILRVFDISYETIFKLLMSVAFVSSGVTFFLWTRRFFYTHAAFIASLLYALAPYHFLNMYVRGDIAELIALAVTPLIFWGIDRAFEQKTFVAVLYGAFFYGIIVLSHNGIGLMFSPVIMSYLLLKIWQKRYFLPLLIVPIGLSVSMFFWLPALYESKYTLMRISIGNMYKEHFPSFLQLISSSWGFGPEVNKIGGLSPQIGIIPVCFVIVGFLLTIINKKKDIFSVYWLCIFLCSVFISLSFSDIFWKAIPLLKLFQFPWRFVALSSFAAAVVAGYVLHSFPKKNTYVYIAIVSMIVVSVIPFMQIKKIPSKGDAFYTHFKGTTYYHNEASTIWTAGDPGAVPKERISFISGQGRIENVRKTTNSYRYIVRAQNDSTLLNRTLYFPGWKVSVNGKKVPIEFQDINHRGLITFKVPKGQHTVSLQYTESPIRLLSNSITLLSIVFVIIVIIFIKVKNHSINIHNHKKS